MRVEQRASRPRRPKRRRQRLRLPPSIPNKLRQQAQAAADKATEAADRATKAVQDATAEINRVSDHLDQMQRDREAATHRTPAFARDEVGEEDGGQ